MKKCSVVITAIGIVFLLCGCSFLQEKAAAVRDELTDMAKLPEVILDDEAPATEETTVVEGSIEETEGTAEAVSELSEAEIYERWSRVVGYWNAAEGRFAVPDMEDNHTAVFRYGIWDSEGRDYGRVIALSATGEEELTAEVYYPATEATEQADAMEEQTLTVMIDYSGLERDGKISIQIDRDGWYQYMFAGNTTEEAYQTYLDNIASQ